ncbi:hypothetical protein [Actinomadura formosensis]|nr:hypothetical protein [Actinomadura formosensis]
MNDRLRQKIDSIRQSLESGPDSYMFAEFNPGASGSADVLTGLPPELRDLLLVTDGLYAGVITVHSTRTIGANQFYCDDLDGGRDAWVCFGGNMDFPFMVERATGAVWWFPEMDAEYAFDSRFERLTGGIDDFIDRYVLGPGYAEQIPAPPEDRWYDFLVAQGLITEGA